ncbi:MAG: hypothetical protein ACK4ZJ_12830, partial [Allorhizobium sp.]
GGSDDSVGPHMERDGTNQRASAAAQEPDGGADGQRAPWRAVQHLHRLANCRHVLHKRRLALTQVLQAARWTTPLTYRAMQDHRLTCPVAPSEADLLRAWSYPLLAHTMRQLWTSAQARGWGLRIYILTPAHLARAPGLEMMASIPVEDWHASTFRAWPASITTSHEQDAAEAARAAWTAPTLVESHGPMDRPEEAKVLEEQLRARARAAERLRRHANATAQLWRAGRPAGPPVEPCQQDEHVLQWATTEALRQSKGWGARVGTAPVVMERAAGRQEDRPRLAPSAARLASRAPNHVAVVLMATPCTALLPEDVDGDTRGARDMVFIGPKPALAKMRLQTLATVRAQHSLQVRVQPQLRMHPTAVVAQQCSEEGAAHVGAEEEGGLDLGSHPLAAARVGVAVHGKAREAVKEWARSALEEQLAADTIGGSLFCSLARAGTSGGSGGAEVPQAQSAAPGMEQGARRVEGAGIPATSSPPAAPAPHPGGPAPAPAPAAGQQRPAVDRWRGEDRTRRAGAASNGSGHAADGTGAAAAADGQGGGDADDPGSLAGSQDGMTGRHVTQFIHAFGLGVVTQAAVSMVQQRWGELLWTAQHAWAYGETRMELVPSMDAVRLLTANLAAETVMAPRQE